MNIKQVYLKRGLIMKIFILILIVLGLLIGNTAIQSISKIESKKADTLEQIYNW